MSDNILSNKAKKTVKLFTVERKHFNREHRYTEVERIIVLGNEAIKVTSEDVEEGLNFDFVPLESLAAGGSSHLSNAFRRILRMNFEAALSNVRQYAAEERNRQFGIQAAPRIQMNNDVVRMFVPPDLQGPNLVWQHVAEPVGQIPLEEGSCTINGARVNNPVAQARIRFQDSMSRVGSGNVCPNGNADPFVQRQRIGEIIKYLEARKNYEAHADGQVASAQTRVPFLNVPFLPSGRTGGESELGNNSLSGFPLMSGLPPLITTMGPSLTSTTMIGIDATTPSTSTRGRAVSRRRGRSAARRFLQSYHISPAMPVTTSQAVADSYNLLLSMRQRPVEMSTQTEALNQLEVVELQDSDDEGQMIIQCVEKLSPMSSDSGAGGEGKKK